MLHVGLLREKQAQVIEAFKQNYVEAFGCRLPTFIPEVSMLMMQPVQHCFDFAGYIAPVPMFQSPILKQPRTLELASFIPYANIGYAEAIPMRYDLQEVFETRTGGIFNAVRFATQNVLAVDMQAQRAIAWANQCLVLPLTQEFNVDSGDKVAVSIAYSAGDAVESLWKSLTATTLPAFTCQPI